MGLFRYTSYLKNFQTCGLWNLEFVHWNLFIGICSLEFGICLWEFYMKENKFRPLKRHEALVSYSREHHHGLLLVWKLRTGQKKGVTVERMAAYILFHYETELKGHFEDEEFFLLPRLPKYHPFRQRLIQDHFLLHELVEEIKHLKSDLGLQISFADALEKHIRFEERKLFQFLQEHLNEDELRELASIERNAPTCRHDDWNDVFWVN